MKVEGTETTEAYYHNDSEVCYNNTESNMFYEEEAQITGNVKAFFNKIGEVKEFPSTSAREPCSNSLYLGDYGTSDTMLHNDVYGSVPEDELDNRPPTPGELIITEKMKNNLRSLLADNPDGIPSSKFCKLYKEKYGETLRFLDYGMSSIQEMIANLPDVFSYQKQRSSANWILFNVNSSVPASGPQKWATNDIFRNTAELAKRYPHGIKKEDFPILYRMLCNADLNVHEVGYDSLESFLQSCSMIKFVTNNGEEYILPSLQSDSCADKPAYPLPPPSEMYGLWNGHFSNDECNPSMNYHPFNLVYANGLSYCKVFACDVINPSLIWLQMDEQREELSKLMHNLNAYYNENESKHILEASYAVMDLMCAVRFDNDNRWHRAKVISRINPNGMIRVRYIDYGTENDVNVTELRKLCKVFGELPVQAIQAGLSRLRPKDSDHWSHESVDYLYDLCFEKKFTMDVQEIDEKIPKLHGILNDEKNQLLVHGSLIRNGYAVYDQERDFPEQRVSNMGAAVDENVFSTMLQENLRIDDASRKNRVRPPPGYCNEIPTMASYEYSSLTCDKIGELREGGIKLHRQIESLIVKARLMFVEADTLEQIICKHPHERCKELQEIMKMYYNEAEHPILEIVRNSSQDSSLISGKSESLTSLSQPKLPPTAPYREPVHQHQYQGFGPMPNTMVGYDHLRNDNSYNAHEPQMFMPQHQQQPHQTPFPMYSPQIHQPPVVHNKMVGRPLVVRSQPPFMGNRMSCPNYPPQQPMIYPQNMPQWGSQWMPAPNSVPRGPHPHSVAQVPLPPGIPQGQLAPQAHTGMYNSYRPEVFSTKPPAIKPVSETPVSESVVPLAAPINPPPSTTPPQTQVMEEAAVTPAVTPSSSPVNDLEFPNSPCDEMVDQASDKESSTVTPPPSPPCNLETSHLSQKQIMKLVNNDNDVVLAPPPTNNWKDLIPSSLTSSNPECSNTASRVATVQHFNQNLINIFKEDNISKKNEITNNNNNNKKLDDETKKLDDAITDQFAPKKEAVNPIMKICVSNISGDSSSILLLLVGDSVAVMFKQLYSCCCLDKNDQDFYSKTYDKLKDEYGLINSIFYADYVLIFEKLREEKYIDDDDLYLPIIHLVDVVSALDIICPPEEVDTTHVKKIFEELSTLVLPYDQFWYSSGRGNSVN